MRPSFAAATSASRRQRPAPVIKAPLPPFPPGRYDRDFDAVWPNGYPVDILHWNGNPWSVTIEGLPFIPGGSSEHPERALTYLINRWTAAWRERIYTAHCEEARTHFTLSPPDMLWSPFADVNCSTQQVVDIFGRVKEWFYAHAMMSSKDCAPGTRGEMWRDPSPQEFADKIGPTLEALLAANVVDIVTPAWEYNLWNRPGTWAQQIHDWVRRTVYATRPTVKLAQHFGVECTYWGDPDCLPDRFAWWRYFNQPLVENGRQTADGFTFLLYQGLCGWFVWDADRGVWNQVSPGTPGAVYRWSVEERQARAVDTISHPDPPKVFVYLEADGDAQFSGDYPNEDQGDLIGGYLPMCTVGQIPVSGAQGGRRPNGRWLSWPNEVRDLPR